MAPGPERFSRFVAIDWSGALAVGRGAIAVAWCTPGDAPPMLLEPAGGWTRSAVLHWLGAAAAAREPWLVGMDFSFAPPFADAGAYLPGASGVPVHARGFWRYVAERATDPDLGARSFIHERHPEHFYFGAASGPKARFQRWRLCEARFNAGGGGKASSVFDCVGASQVAKASFAGMRLLSALGDTLPVWPFDADPGQGPMLTEIYCRSFIRHAGLRGLKLRSGEALDAALGALGSRPTGRTGPMGDHATDVLISAAGLRRLTLDLRWWSPAGLETVRQTEGWTFGVA